MKSRRRQTALRLVKSAGLWALLATGGCELLPWGEGGLDDALDPARVSAGGLIVASGADTLPDMERRLDGLIRATWPNGMRLQGQASLDSNGTPPGAELELAWSGSTVNLGAPSLTFEGDTLFVSLSAFVDANLTLGGSGAVECTPEIKMDPLTLSLGVKLTSDKTGKIVADLSKDPTLVGIVEGDWRDCAAALGLANRGGGGGGDGGGDGDGGGPWDDAAGWPDLSAELLQNLRDDIASAAIPPILAGLPRILGLNNSLGVSKITGSSPGGQGLLRVSIEAHADGGIALEDGGVVATYDVGVDAAAHLCMPAALVLTDRNEVYARPIPVVGSAAALYVGYDVIEAALEAAWLSGMVCGGQATQEIRVRARDWSHAWPQLSTLSPDAYLTMRLWPRELPQLRADVPGASLEIATGAMDIDIYGAIDGAQVRLATISVAAEVEASPVIVRPDTDGPGQLAVLALQPTRIRTVASGGVPGLFQVPPATAAQAILEPVIGGIFERMARLPLPPVAERLGDVVSIGDEGLVVGR